MNKLAYDRQETITLFKTILDVVLGIDCPIERVNQLYNWTRGVSISRQQLLSKTFWMLFRLRYPGRLMEFMEDEELSW